MADLKKDVKYIKSVGPERVKLLNKLGIFTLEDLITYYPREYEDRSKLKKIVDVQNDEEVLISGIVTRKMTEKFIRKNMIIYTLYVRDETSFATLTWYNQPYLKNMFKEGLRYNFYGKAKNTFGQIDINSPVFDFEGENKNTGKIIPIYPLTNYLSQNTIRKIMENGLKEINNSVEETLPQYILDDYNLCSINEAIKNIHFPEKFQDFEYARKRLAFEELFSLQLALITLKNKYSTNKQGICFNNNIKMSEMINSLPFKLTNAQIRVLEEIDKDMENVKPMNRLLQGDVGCGKTVVAITAIYKAVKSGYQATIMAPTSILAMQHFENFNKMLDKFDIRCEILTSNTTKKKKGDILKKIENGEIDVLIGTHSIIEENVIFKNLGLAVTDEQHRFGVRQRGILTGKGKNPDVLVMTATPIPRTLALILYGDLDISIIDELPPNRKKIETFAVQKGMETRVNNFVKNQIQKGRQCYIVCPLVEENEEINAKAVLELSKKYKNEIFSEFRVEYIHGKLKPKEKEEIMLKFKSGDIDILISTTVIEVGVDVPNSSIMVIENAERFGLATLHQLRGRVGRGEYQSYCILKYQGNSELIKQRMKIMVETNNGFVISEKDLELRGTGEFFGIKQHGLPEFKIANLFEDMELLKSVQSVVIKVLEQDPTLEQEKNKTLRQVLETKFFKNQINI